MKNYDVVIAGGAMAGGTLALALDNLSKGSLSIAVVEPFQVDKEPHPGFDSRSIALSYGTRLILEQFKLWQDIEPVTTSIDHIHVSERGHAGMTDISSLDQAVPALGYVIELADIGSLYAKFIQKSKHIDLFCPDSVTSITRSETHSIITLSSGQSIQGQLLVAADGADSACCRLLGHDNSTLDFNQIAVITNIEVAKPHKGWAFERFTPNGPLALLPMSDNRMSVVWCVEPEKAQEIVQLEKEVFTERLQQEFGWRLGKIVKSGDVASYPLILKKKKQLVSHRFATVGNAAQLLHPIAGQGFNLGIRDIRSLVRHILDRVDPPTKADVGDYALLSAYQASRENDREQTIGLISSMVHIFSNDYFSMRLGRNFALMAMDNVSFLTMPLLNRTMGLVEK